MMSLISLIQTQKTQEEQYAPVKVGLKEVTIFAGHVVHIKCKVPPKIDPSDSVVLFEPTLDSVQLEALSMGTYISLMDWCH